jgi:hypothetical protein
MQILLSIVLAVLPFQTPAAPAADVLERRAREAAAICAKEPAWPEDLFDADFQKQVPPARMRAIGLDYFSKCGALEGVQLVQRQGPWAGKYDLLFEKERVVPMTITVSEKPPHPVVGLWYGMPEPLMKDVAAAVKLLEKLPGKVSFAVWKLGGEEPEVLAELAPDASLAIGSAFKLYVLGALVKDVAEGKRKAADVVALVERHRSLPTGQMQEWPVGAPVTLATLASMMISISDNTATDHLLFALGRERVEAQLGPMGNAQPARSIPFLATHELFRLKETRGGAGAEAYLELDLAGKRAYLEKEVPTWPLTRESIDHGSFSKPNRIDTLEWFASAADLCRALDWLRVNTQKGPAAPLRDVLTINRGLDVSKELFPWAGFKGGSEPGVLNLSFLLQAKNGSWYALSAGWNDTAANVDEAALMPIVQRALHVLGKSAK